MGIDPPLGLYHAPDTSGWFGCAEESAWCAVASGAAIDNTSVLNQYQQAWDVDNLFVMDGAGFTSGGCQNPTLTIMALAVRSTDYLLQQMKEGSL